VVWACDDNSSYNAAVVMAYDDNSSYNAAVVWACDEKGGRTQEMKGREPKADQRAAGQIVSPKILRRRTRSVLT